MQKETLKEFNLFSFMEGYFLSLHPPSPVNHKSVSEVMIPISTAIYINTDEIIDPDNETHTSAYQ